MANALTLGISPLRRDKEAEILAGYCWLTTFQTTLLARWSRERSSGAMH